MDKEEALKIISMIVDGLDPYGEKDASKNLPEINPITIRAVCIALASLLQNKEKEDLRLNYSKTRLTEMIESVSGPLKENLKEKEKNEIGKALLKAQYNENEAAKILRIAPHELKQKVKDYRLEIFILARNFLDKDAITTLDRFLRKLETSIILEALSMTNHNINKAADLLGITFRSLRYRIESFEINKKVHTPNTNYLVYFEIRSLDEFLKKAEKEIILQAYRRTNFKKTETANLLGISFRSLRYRIDQLGIKAD